MRLIDADKLIEAWERDGNRQFYADHFIFTIDQSPTIKTKQVIYYDEDGNVWKVGSVIVDEHILK